MDACPMARPHKRRKDRSRFMLLKHESRDEFYDHATSLGCTFTPDNTAEILVVESIITDEWRLRRARSMATVLMQDAFNDADADSNPAELICQLTEIKASQPLNRTALAKRARPLHPRLDFISKSFAPPSRTIPRRASIRAVRAIPAYTAAPGATLMDPPDPHLAAHLAKPRPEIKPDYETNLSLSFVNFTRGFAAEE